MRTVHRVSPTTQLKKRSVRQCDPQGSSAVPFAPAAARRRRIRGDALLFAVMGMNWHKEVGEVVRVGVGHGRIAGVTRERIEYIDEAGQALFIDLTECLERWARYKESIKGDLIPTNSPFRFRLQEVGKRDTSASPPWVQFANERRTRFEFVRGGAHEQLLLPLMSLGYWLFDLT